MHKKPKATQVIWSALTVFALCLGDPAFGAKRWVNIYCEGVEDPRGYGTGPLGEVLQTGLEMSFPFQFEDSLAPAVSVDVDDIVNGTGAAADLSEAVLSDVRKAAATEENCQACAALAPMCQDCDFLSEKIEEYERKRAQAENDWHAIYNSMNGITGAYRDVQGRTIKAFGDMLVGEVWSQVTGELPADLKSQLSAASGSKKLSAGQVFDAIADYAAAIVEALRKDSVESVNTLFRIYRVMKPLVDTLTANTLDKQDVRFSSEELLDSLRLAEETTEDAWDLFLTIKENQNMRCPNWAPGNALDPPVSPPELSGMELYIKTLYVLSEGLSYDEVLENVNRFFEEYERYEADQQYRESQNRYLQTGATSMYSTASSLAQMSEPVEGLEEASRSGTQSLASQ